MVDFQGSKGCHKILSLESNEQFPGFVFRLTQPSPEGWASFWRFRCLEQLQGDFIQCARSLATVTTFTTCDNVGPAVATAARPRNHVVEGEVADPWSQAAVLAPIFIASEDIAAAKRNGLEGEAITVNESNDSWYPHPTSDGSNEVFFVAEVAVLGLKAKPGFKGVRRDCLVANRHRFCAFLE